MNHPTAAGKRAALLQLYSLLESAASEYTFACQRKCSVCCTRNVVLTSLEAYYLAESIGLTEKADCIEALRAAQLCARFHPKITTNQLAAVCARDETPPTETIDPGCGACPFLASAECLFYDLRPCACRAMVSTRRCGAGDAAEMPEFLFALNNVILQYIEHVDADGFSGNLTDMLLFMAVPENRRMYAEGRIQTLPEHAIPNHPVSVLMTPPEYREQINAVLQKLR